MKEFSSLGNTWQVEEEVTAEGLIVLSEYRVVHHGTRITTGYASLDGLLGGLGEAAMSVVTGKRGEGKSTFAGELALNAVQDKHKVCFYSGELSAGMFQDWIYSQAAGEDNMVRGKDRFGNDIWEVDPFITARIEAWLGKNFILYDNSKILHREHDGILERFHAASVIYGCDLFFVDNLMTAKFGLDTERDYYRAQANFANSLLKFAQTHKAHVILIAHPRKGESGDINEDVSGSGDITNLATNVLQIRLATEKEKNEKKADGFITVSKNREFGRKGRIRLRFDPISRRLIDMDKETTSGYGWIDLC